LYQAVVSDSCTVLIGAADLLPALQTRAGHLNGEVLAFSDDEALRALETITRRRPTVIVLERLFSVSPRGTALINRIKADRSLQQAEIRVFAHDSDYTRIVPHAPPPLPQSIDQRGTRRAPRFKMVSSASMIVEGKTSPIVDLSTVGAQVLSPTMLKPNQLVSAGLVDDVTNAKFKASVAWTKFEVTPGGVPVFRSGINFVDADAATLDAYCKRYRATA
jgi:hypothetical protein